MVQSHLGVDGWEKMKVKSLLRRTLCVVARSLYLKMKAKVRLERSCKTWAMKICALMPAMVSCAVIIPASVVRGSQTNPSSCGRTYAKLRKRAGLLARLSLYAGSTCVAAANGTVTLAWDPNPDSATAGYMLYYGSSSGVYTNAIDVRHNITNTVSGLVDGVTYNFVVTAYNLAGLESDFSAELTYRLSSNNNPTLASIPNLTISEDAGPQTVILQGISSGASNEIQTLSVTAQANNSQIVS